MQPARIAFYPIYKFISAVSSSAVCIYSWERDSDARALFSPIGKCNSVFPGCQCGDGVWSVQKRTASLFSSVATTAARVPINCGARHTHKNNINKKSAVAGKFAHKDLICQPGQITLSVQLDLISSSLQHMHSHHQAHENKWACAYTETISSQDLQA